LASHCPLPEKTYGDPRPTTPTTTTTHDPDPDPDPDPDHDHDHDHDRDHDHDHDHDPSPLPKKSRARHSRRAPFYMATLQPWHDFFLLVGTASATLLGLIFVAASIAATIPNEKLGDMGSRALWVLPIVYAFLRVLVVSAVGVIPGQTGRSFGGVGDPAVRRR
jgi:hypothetical protein